MHFLNDHYEITLWPVVYCSVHVVKLGRAEKCLGTAPSLCVWIFTLVRQSALLQALVPRRKHETPTLCRGCYYFAPWRLQGPLHTCTKPKAGGICMLSVPHVSGLSDTAPSPSPSCTHAQRKAWPLPSAFCFYDRSATYPTWSRAVFPIS